MLQSVGVRSVIVLNDFCQVQGGASRVAVDEAVALDARGFDVTFLGAVGPVCLELRAANVKTVCLDQPELADAMRDRKSTRLNSSHSTLSRMPSSA